MNICKPHIKIAIADDHILIRDSLIEAIHAFKNCRVISRAANGQELINNLGSLEALPDVCIVDISMPVLNGYETVVALKKLYPEIKILVLSMFIEEYSIIRMIKNGARGYLLKSCRTEELKEAIESIHTNGFYYSKTASEEAFILVHQHKIAELTEKEIQVLTLFCSDLSYQEIAEQLHLSVRTIDDHKDAISKKFKIKTRTGLALLAVQSGLVRAGKH